MRQSTLGILALALLASGCVGDALEVDATGIEQSPDGPDGRRPGRGFWHVQGSTIVDENGREVRIAGVNWGWEVYDADRFDELDGSRVANYRAILDAIAAFGFNTIRFYFRARHTFGSRAPNPCLFHDAGGHNPELAGKTCLEVMDAVIAYAEQKRLRVILDHHTINGSWARDEGGADYFPIMWRKLARRYRGNPTVVGADLDNEPGALCWGPYDAYTGQDDCTNPNRDWRRAAEGAAREIFTRQNDWLIIVEGLNKASDLSFIARYPARIDADKLVYSAHVYPGLTHGVPNDDPNGLMAVWESRFGFLVTEGTAPVLVGEFATTQVGNGNQIPWFRTLLLDYIKAKGISSCFWAWHWVPDSAAQESWYTYRLIEPDFVHTVVDDPRRDRAPIFAQWQFRLGRAQPPGTPEWVPPDRDPDE